MIDFSTLSQVMILARGEYATVRGEHEDRKRDLQVLCGKLSATSAQILRKMQPDNDAIPDATAISDLLAVCRWTVNEIERTVALVESLSQQRATLRPIAWPK
jgi:hypothetical protein